MNEQDMEAADEIIFQWSARTPSGRREWLAGVIAQARVDAERERDALQVSVNLAGRDVLLLREDRDALAAQIEVLRKALLSIRMTDCPNVDCECCPEHDTIAGRALATPPAASLIAHDNALIERCAAVVQNWIGSDVRGTTLFAMAAHVRALKTDSEGATGIPIGTGNPGADMRVSDSELAFMLESGLHEWTPELLALDLRDSRAEVAALQARLDQARKALRAGNVMADHRLPDGLTPYLAIEFRDEPAHAVAALLASNPEGKP